MSQTMSLGKAIALGIGSVLLSELLCLFISFTCSAFAVSFAVGRYISIICTAAIHIGIMADYGVKMAKQDALEQRRDGKKILPVRRIILSVATGVPTVFLWGVLVVLKISGGFNFLPLYRFLNAPFFQLLTFACGDHTIQTLPMSRIFAFLLMALVAPISVYGAYLYAYLTAKKKT